MIGAGGAERAADERDTAGIEDKLEVATVVRMREGEAAPVAAEQAAVVLVVVTDVTAVVAVFTRRTQRSQATSREGPRQMNDEEQTGGLRQTPERDLTHERRRPVEAQELNGLRSRPLVAQKVRQLEIETELLQACGDAS